MSIEEKYIEIFLKDLLIGCTGSQLQHAISLLQSTDCLVVAHRLSCPVACGILVPQPGIKPMSPALQGRFLTTGPPGKSPLLSPLDIHCLSTLSEKTLESPLDCKESSHS